MDTPTRESRDIIDIVESKLEAALGHVAAAESRINESLARQEKSAAERETGAAEREMRLMRWFASIMAAAVVVLGLWIELRDRPAVSPVTVHIPPAIQSMPLSAPPPVAADSR